MTLLQLAPINSGLFAPDLADAASLFTKALFVIGAFCYVIFSLVVTRQAHIMRSTVETSFSPVVMVLAYLHLILSFMVLFLFALYL